MANKFRMSMNTEFMNVSLKLGKFAINSWDSDGTPLI